MKLKEIDDSYFSKEEIEEILNVEILSPTLEKHHNAIFDNLIKKIEKLIS